MTRILPLLFCLLPGMVAAATPEQIAEMQRMTAKRYEIQNRWSANARSRAAGAFGRYQMRLEASVVRSQRTAYLRSLDPPLAVPSLSIVGMRTDIPFSLGQSAPTCHRRGYGRGYGYGSHRHGGF